ncbi:UNVERIFIED_CONTAM: hypothetical protein K2H54_071331 [Gekko kuhli]
MPPWGHPESPSGCSQADGGWAVSDGELQDLDRLGKEQNRSIWTTSDWRSSVWPGTGTPVAGHATERMLE